MTVKELKELINDLPDNMEVILQKDSEGNGYSPLYGGDAEAIYIPENKWSGEIWDSTWSAEDSCMDEKLWEEFKLKPRSLVLYPIN